MTLLEPLGQRVFTGSLRYVDAARDAYVVGHPQDGREFSAVSRSRAGSDSVPGETAQRRKADSDAVRRPQY